MEEISKNDGFTFKAAIFFFLKQVWEQIHLMLDKNTIQLVGTEKVRGCLKEKLPVIRFQYAVVILLFKISVSSYALYLYIKVTRKKEKMEVNVLCITASKL